MPSRLKVQIPPINARKIMYKSYNFFDVLMLIVLLALPLTSFAQNRENENPSLPDTLQWISDNLENYQFGKGSLKFTYFKPIIDGCKITITDKYESALGMRWHIVESTVTGMLSDIHPDYIDIISDNTDDSSVQLQAYIKKDSTLFDRQDVRYGNHTGSYTKEFSNYEDVFFTLRFHNQTFANRFKKAIAHAAKLCAQQEISKPRKNKELF